MNLSEHFPLLVGEEHVGLRLDQFLAQSFESISRVRWTRIIDSGSFKVDGRPASSSIRVKLGQKLEFQPTEEFLESVKQSSALSDRVSRDALVFTGIAPEVIFEDETLLVINKPVGLAVHPGSGLPLENTLVAWLIQEKKIASASLDAYLTADSEMLEHQRPGIVHRLDQGTSGALVIAKNPEAHRLLAAQFASREAGRLYWALVKGDPSTLLEKRPRRFDELLKVKPSPIAFRGNEAGLYTFASYLSRDPQHRTRFRVSPTVEGRKALTHFCKIQTQGPWSLVELKLETGRTHQIRAHLAFLEFSVVGDEFYGGGTFSRMMLHAHRLQLTHPESGLRMQFEAPWPDADAAWLKQEGIQLESRISALLGGHPGEP